MEIKSNFIPYQAQSKVINSILNDDVMYHTLVSSRQSGKTLIALNLLLYYAINYPDSYNVLVSPVFSQSKKCFLELQKSCGDNNPLVTSTNASELLMVFKNGSVIRMLSGESNQNLRGFTCSGIMILDEAAFVPEQLWTEILRPATMIRGRKVLFISTPNGFNWFYDMYQRGEDPVLPDYRSYRITSYENPYLKPEILEDARKTIPDKSFAQEYLGVFIEGGGSVFEFGHCATLPFIGGIPQEGRTYYGGLDLAIANDWTVLTIMDDLGNVVDIFRENKTSWEQIVDRVITRIKKWNCKLLVEKNSIGSVVFEQLQKACPNLVTGFNTTQDSKMDIIESLKLSFSNSLIKLPSKEASQILHNELSMFTYKLLPSGKVSYSAPGGMTDDCVMSLSFVNWHRNQLSKRGTIAFHSMGRKSGALRG